MLAIGFVAAFVYQLAFMLLRKLNIDDPMDAGMVHGACAVWGVIAAVIFDMGLDKGHFHGWSGFSCVTTDGGDCQEGLFSDASQHTSS